MMKANNQNYHFPLIIQQYKHTEFVLNINIRQYISMNNNQGKQHTRKPSKIWSSFTNWLFNKQQPSKSQLSNPQNRQNEKQKLLRHSESLKKNAFIGQNIKKSYSGIFDPSIQSQKVRQTQQQVSKLRCENPFLRQSIERALAANNMLAKMNPTIQTGYQRPSQPNYQQRPSQFNYQQRPRQSNYQQMSSQSNYQQRPKMYESDQRIQQERQHYRKILKFFKRLGDQRVCRQQNQEMKEKFSFCEQRLIKIGTRFLQKSVRVQNLPAIATSLQQIQLQLLLIQSYNVEAENKKLQKPSPQTQKQLKQNRIRQQIQKCLQQEKLQKSKLQQQMDQLQQNLICIICLVKRKATINKPCNHISCCQQCIERVQKCPLCRSRILSHEKIYL